MGLEPAVPGLDCPLAQTYVPLMTWLLWALSKLEHEKSGLDDCMLKPPRTSLRAGRETLQGVSGSLNQGRIGRDLLGEVATEVKGSSDGLQCLEAIDDFQLGVVRDLVSAVDRLEHRERDVGQLDIVVKHQRAADSGQVRCGKALEKVLVETHGSVDGPERWQFHVAAVAERHVVRPLQVGERSGQTSAVGLDRQRLADVSQLRLHLSQVRVVVDVERVHGLQVDTGQGSELGVGDQDIGGSRDLGGEAQVLQVRQSIPRDTIHHGETRKGERGKDGQVGQLERFVDDGQAIPREGGQFGRAIGDEIPRDSLDAIELNGIGGLCSNDDVATEGCAARQSRRITAILDRRGCLAALSCFSPTKY